MFTLTKVKAEWLKLTEYFMNKVLVDLFMGDFLWETARFFTVNTFILIITVDALILIITVGALILIITIDALILIITVDALILIITIDALHLQLQSTP